MLDAERTWGIQKRRPLRGGGGARHRASPTRTSAPSARRRTSATTVFVPGFDFINNDTHANDDNFHGTHVASVIAEATNNGEGVAGLAFGCALMPVKVLDAEGFGLVLRVAEGIDFAVTHQTAAPVKVINLSLGGESGSQHHDANAIDRAVAAGITVVAAAGNESDGHGQRSRPPSATSSPWARWTAARPARPTPTSARRSTWWPPAATSSATTRGPDGGPTAGPTASCSRPSTRDTAAEPGRYDDFALLLRGGHQPGHARTWPRWPRCSTGRASPIPRRSRPPIESTRGGPRRRRTRRHLRPRPHPACRSP